MLTSILHKAQQELGACFAAFGEWELPAGFGDPIAEHHAVRNSAGLFDRSARGKLVTTGADRFTWLQGMVSNDVRLLASGAMTALQACILNATGHLLADVTIVNRGDSLLIDLPWERRVAIFEYLDQFIIAEDVEIVDQSESLACLSVQGSGVDESSVRSVAGDRSTVISADHTGEVGLDLYVLTDEEEPLWSSLVRSGLTPIGETAADTLRIEAGIPRYGVDMDESTMPLECGLASTHISETKGCYVGQEIIARIQSRGHTNRALTGFFVEGSELPIKGERILLTKGDGKEVGWITSACHSPSLQRPIALGYLRHEHREPGTLLRTANSIRLAVTDLPFVRSIP